MFENIAEYNKEDAKEIDELLQELKELNDLMEENDICNIADYELKEYIGKFLNKQYILEKTLLNMQINKCKKENYDISKFNELFKEIMDLKRKYLHNKYSKYIDKNAVGKGIDELIHKMNEKEFECLSEINIKDFDDYLKYRDVFSRNSLIREHYFKSLIDTKKIYKLEQIYKMPYSEIIKLESLSFVGLESLDKLKKVAKVFGEDI